MYYREIDMTDAACAATRLCRLPHMAFLDSAMRHPQFGRYSYVAADPFGTFTSRNGLSFWNGQPLGEPPLDALRALLKQYRCDQIAGGPPFQAGCIGFFSYDFGRQLEVLGTPESDDGLCDDSALHFYDVVFAVDHLEQRGFLLSSGLPETEPRKRAIRAEERFDTVLKYLTDDETGMHDRQSLQGEFRWTSNFSREAYMAAVEQVKDYILAGDIYQANIAQTFTSFLPEGFDPWRFYRALRHTNPAPFAAYMNFDGYVLASSSPERFLRLEGGQVEARPIKGTAQRFADPAKDQKAAEDLLASEKDRAENVMIVDLLRNDLSRVCKPGSVEVPTLCALESYASVHHLVSVVTGQLHRNCDGLDLLRAAFPGGSITGAPKIRAMDIITEVEKSTRQVYCGSLGYIAFNGDMDLNIAIRTVVLGGGKARFQAGGGITVLSDPASEYEETLLKAQRIFDAFRTLYDHDREKHGGPS